MGEGGLIRGGEEEGERLPDITGDNEDDDDEAAFIAAILCSILSRRTICL